MKPPSSERMDYNLQTFGRRCELHCHDLGTPKLPLEPRAVYRSRSPYTELCLYAFQVKLCELLDKMHLKQVPNISSVL